MSDNDVRVEYMRLNDYTARFNEANPKDHDIGYLEGLMNRFGFVEVPIIDERSGQVVSGHGRGETLKEKMDSGESPPARIKVDEDGMWMLPVAPNAVTFPELVPEGYPFLFNSVDHQKAILETILRDFESIYNEWRPKLQEHARKKFGIEAYTRRYLEIIAEVEQQRRDSQTPKPHVLKAANDVISSMQTGKLYSLKELTRKFQKLSGTSNQAAPPARIVREASMRGCRFIWKNGVYIERTG